MRYSRLSLAALALVTLAAAVSATDPCTSWPAACALTPSESFITNSSSILHIGVGEYAYFNFTVPNPVPAYVRLSLSAVSGDPDVYICVNATDQPSFIHWDFSSRSSGTEDAVTLDSTQLVAAGHTFVLAVHGFRESQYRLTYLVADNTTTITDGQSVTDSVGLRQYNYYRFVSTMQTPILTIVLTRLYGDPDLVVGIGSYLPTLQRNNGSQLTFGDDVLALNTASLPVGTTYTIGVYGSVNSQYTLVVTQNDSITLLDGVPQAQSLAPGAPASFQFLTTGSSGLNLTLLIQVTSGSLEFFMSSSAGSAPVYPSGQSYDWTGFASYSSSYQLTISANDPKYIHVNGGYYIVVHSTAAQGVTAFTVTMKSETAVSPLQDGEPVSDSISAGQYRYYSFSVSSNTLDVLFDLTPISGDADIFVSCTKNLTGDDSGTPSRRNSTWNSQLWGEDTLAILHSDARSCVLNDPLGRGGTFYVAVFGFANAAYTITASVDDGLPTRLLIGQPQVGTALRGAAQLYIVTKPLTSDNLTITVSPTLGDPDVYVSLDGNTPNSTYYAYKATGASGVDSVIITPSGSGCSSSRTPAQCYCTTCDITIAVVAFSARASYTITVSTGESSTTLQDGVPFRGTVSLYSYAYFKFIISQAGSSVRIALTSLSGDPDLTAAMTPNPTLANGTWVALNQGNDVITAHNVPIGTMYIGVFGFTNSSFSLTAHVTSGNMTSQLVNGQPQFGSVAATDYQYYAYSVDVVGDLTFTVTPISGTADVYVNTCVNMSLSECNSVRPTRQSSTWNAAASLSGETVSISKLDPRACSGCVYIIGVQGVSNCNFTILASTDASSSATDLQEFVPYRSSVAQWQYQYFVFTFYAVHADVVISVTPFTGDPDLYVSACYEAGDAACVYQPTNRTSTWKHSAVGADTLVIPFGSAGACVPHPPNPCSYYIGVHGFTAATFSVLAYLHSDLPVILIDGRPQNGIVNASVYDQYSMIVPPGSASIDITLVPRSGDSDLFVRLDNQKPTQDFWQYRAISAFGNDNIEILASDPVFQASNCSRDGCILRIAVLGFQTSEYSLVATTSGTSTSLLPGVPLRDSVQKGSYDYYVFSVDQKAPLQIIVTPLSGDPDVFVGWGPGYQHPNMSSYMWASQRVGVDAVTINPSDRNFCDPTTGPCNYYIGVYGYSQNTSFVLTAYVNSANPVELVDGQPQNGEIGTALTQQYVFYASKGFKQMDVVLSPIFGDPDLFVSVNSTTPPGPSSFDYNSMATSGPEQITILETDAKIASRCGQLGGSGDDNLCPIYIAVNGFTNASYSIMVSSQASSDLSAGVPLYGTVTQGSYRYYVFHNDEPNTKLSFAVTPYSGDPDVYVSVVNTQPTAANHTWASAGLGRDVVEINVEDPSYCTPPCNYYIGVTSFSDNASYTITASQEAYSIVQLVDGEPQVGVLGKGSTDQFFIYVPVGIPTITITLTSLFGDADLYVTLNDTVAPGPNNFEYFSMSATGDDIITISATDFYYSQSECNPARAGGAAFCVVRLAIAGFSDLCIYAIVASSSNAVLLLDGIPQSASANRSVYNQYIFEHRYSLGEVDFVVTPIAGDPDLYVSTTPPANSTTAQWRANSMGVDVVQIFKDDPNACQAPCRYYLGVTGFASESVYTITGRSKSSSPSLLVNGRPQTDFVNASMSKLYFFDASASSPSFTIRVSAVYGDPDIYVRLDNVPPTARNAQFRSLSNAADDTLTISTADPLFTNCTAHADGNNNGASCRVYIAIVGFTASQYQVTAINADSTQQLQEGVPASGSVNSTQYQFYKFIAASAKPYTFTVTPLSGDPDMYISWRNATPTLYNNTWFSNGLGTETITIDTSSDPLATPCGIPCTFYIGVTGFLRPSAYQLLATSTYTLLLDGQPQQGHVAAKSMVYFRYRAGSAPGDISFLVTNLQGNVELYVANGYDAQGNQLTPTPDCTGSAPSPCSVTNYNWTSLSSFDQSSISIRATDRLACKSCYYVIGVLSNSLTDAADFSLVAASSDAIIVLADGVPHTDTVPQGTYQYYRVMVTQPGVDVEIITSPFFGDPDIYVSWTQGNSRPNASSHDASATSQYNDTVYIQAVQLQACMAQASGAGCQIYVGVFGFTTASYSIVSRLMTGFLSPIVLVMGVPQSAVVSTNEYVYFSAYVNVADGTTYSFAVTPTYGDPDVYVTTDESEPSQINFNYSSTTQGFDSIVIAPGSKGYCTRCTILIGVYGFQASQFNILFTTNTTASVVPLRDGVPVYTQMGGGTYQYYKIYIDAATQEFTVSISALSGNPQTYIILESNAGGRYVLPSASNYIWSSVAQGGSVTVVSKDTDSRFVAPGTYVIGVYSETTAWYFITAQLSQTSMTSLHDGQPQVSYVDANDYAYFVFTTGSLPPSQVTVRVSNPSITLYAVDNYDSANPATLPSRTNFIWTSLTDVTNQNILLIPASTASNKYYTIAAYSTVSTSFTISAATQEQVITLMPGAPSSRFSISQNVTQHFLINLYDMTKDLIISVAPLTGDPDLYASRRYQNPGCIFPAGRTPSPWFPNNVCSNYTWSATSDQRDVLQIRAAAPCTSPPATSTCTPSIDWVAGQFYVGVFAYTDTVFDITVLQSTGVTQLVAGQTQFQITSTDLKTYFVLQVPKSANKPSVRFDVSAYTTIQPNGTSPANAPAGVTVFVYACRSGSCAAVDNQPGPSHATWVQFVSVTNSPSSLFIVDLDPHYCDPTTEACNYFVGVYPDSRCSNAECNMFFSISATVQDGSGLQTIRFNDVNSTVYTVPDVVPEGSGTGTRYELWLGPATAGGANPAPLYFELDACYGDYHVIPTLYVCSTGCPNASQPAAPNNRNYATKITTANGGWGKAQVPVPTSAPVMYAAVTATTNPTDDAVDVTPHHARHLAIPWRRELSQSRFLTMPLTDGSSYTYVLKVASAARVLTVGAASLTLTLSNSPETHDGNAIMGFEVSWNGAGVYDLNGVLQVHLTNVQYTVYYAESGFPVNIQKGTPCGLDQANVQKQVLNTGTHFIADNLTPETRYEVNVVAYCGEQCWQASGLANSGAVLVDRIAYRSSNVYTPATPTRERSKSNNVGITVLIVVLVVLGVGVGVGLFIYYRRKKSQRVYQYEMFEMDGVGTYSTPGDAYTAME